MEIDAEFEAGTAGRFGMRIGPSGDGAGDARIYYETATGDFCVDGRVLHKGHGPAYLAPGSTVRIRVFVDRQVVEAFVNGQACTTILQVTEPGRSRSVVFDELDLFSDRGGARCIRLDVWRMEGGFRH